MAKNKTYLPQSVAGLISFYEEKHTQVLLKPEHVLAFGAGFGAVVLLLRILMPV